MPRSRSTALRKVIVATVAAAALASCSDSSSATDDAATAAHDQRAPIVDLAREDGAAPDDAAAMSDDAGPLDDATARDDVAPPTDDDLAHPAIADAAALPDATAAADAMPVADATPAADALSSTPDLVAMTMPPPGLCATAPPQGATLPAALPVYKGTCPKLVAGDNDIQSSGAKRTFLLALPKNLDPNERPPVIFLWHWLGGSANGFYQRGEVQKAVDTQRFIAVLPHAKGDLTWKWPFNVADSQARMDEEMRFFDDMLACVGAQYHVNTSCVSSAGVSAGALFTDQLAAARSQYLASAISLSGGVGGIIRGWGKPSHELPMIVLWGGPTDQCFGVMNFEAGSKQLEKDLGSQGNFFLECTHNCGHAEPPFEGPVGLSKYAGLWQFVFDHPFWLKAGESPYKSGPLPKGIPPWCGVGKGGATPRTGACPDKPGC